MKIGTDPKKGRKGNGYQKGFQEGDYDLQVQELLLVLRKSTGMQGGS